MKDMVGQDMLMPKHIIEHFPDEIFDNDVKPLISQRKHISPVKVGKKSAAFGITIKDEFNKFSFDSLIRCKEDNGLGLTVEENKAVDAGTASADDAGCDMKAELDDDCIDVETVSEQIPGEYTLVNTYSSNDVTQTLPPLKVTAVLRAVGTIVWHVKEGTIVIHVLMDKIRWKQMGCKRFCC